MKTTPPSGRASPHTIAQGARHAALAPARENRVAHETQNVKVAKDYAEHQKQTLKELSK